MAQRNKCFSTILRLLNLDTVVNLTLTCSAALDLTGEANKIHTYPVDIKEAPEIGGKCHKIT